MYTSAIQRALEASTFITSALHTGYVSRYITFSGIVFKMRISTQRNLEIT